jgi:hypothetical protein
MTTVPTTIPMARVVAFVRRVGPLLVAAVGIALLVVLLVGGHRPTGAPTTGPAPVTVPASGSTCPTCVYTPVPAGKP